ncbi:kinesin light chain [Apiospora arundinis]
MAKVMMPPALLFNTPLILEGGVKHDCRPERTSRSVVEMGPGQGFPSVIEASHLCKRGRQKQKRARKVSARLSSRMLLWEYVLTKVSSYAVLTPMKKMAAAAAGRWSSR